MKEQEGEQAKRLRKEWNLKYKNLKKKMKADKFLWYEWFEIGVLPLHFKL